MSATRSASVLLLAFGLAAPAMAAEAIGGPVDGAVTRVVDGDTFEFVAHVWLGLALTVHVRVRGIDTPEVRGKCPREKELASLATAQLGELLVRGAVLVHVGDDKYFGRVVADVIGAGGTDVAVAMIASGLARPYDGGTRASWCDASAVGG